MVVQGLVHRRRNHYRYSRAYGCRGNCGNRSVIDSGRQLSNRIGGSGRALNEATLLVARSAIFFPASSRPLEEMMSLDGWLMVRCGPLPLQLPRFVRRI